jgi:hypothetical protein
MACSLTIASVTGTGPAGSPTVTVTGTGTDCAEVDVALDCGSGPPLTEKATVTAGAWSATFQNTGCPCGSEITVSAQCTTDAACTATLATTLFCDNCPLVDVDVTVGDCNAMGLREVTFDVTVTPPPGVLLVFTEIEFEPGQFSGAQNALTWSATHAFATGAAPTPVLHILVPTGCADVAIPVPLLEACEAQCPLVTPIPNYGDCPNETQRIIQFTALYTGPGGPITVRMRYGPALADVSMDVPLTPQPVPQNVAERLYDRDAVHTATLEIVDPPDCPSTSVTFGPLAPCSSTPVPPQPIEPVEPTPPPIPEPPDSESVSCLGLRWVILLFAALSSFFFLLFFCPNGGPLFHQQWQLTAALAMLAVAVGLLIIWYFICEAARCQILRLAWEWPLVSAMLALYLSGCCTGYVWLALGLMAGAMTAYVTWELTCDIDPCDRLKEWTFTLATIAVGLFSALALYPLPCALTQVAAVNGIIAALVTAYTLATCLGPNRPENPPQPPGNTINPPRLPRRGRKRPCGCK